MTKTFRKACLVDCRPRPARLGCEGSVTGSIISNHLLLPIIIAEDHCVGGQPDARGGERIYALTGCNPMAWTSGNDVDD